jgi:hypothetical protein
VARTFTIPGRTVSGDRRNRRRVGGSFESVDPAHQPAPAAHAEEIARMGGREEFEFGLAALLDGIEARLGETQIS